MKQEDHQDGENIRPTAMERQESVLELYYVFEKRYEFEVTPEQMASSPLWNPAEEPNPPLAAAVALGKSEEFIAAVPPPPDCDWAWENLSLIRLDEDGHWAWSARYRLKLRGFSSGVAPHMDTWVLMDGSVLQPQVTLIRQP